MTMTLHVCLLHRTGAHWNPRGQYPEQTMLLEIPQKQGRKQPLVVLDQEGVKEDTPHLQKDILSGIHKLRQHGWQHTLSYFFPFLGHIMPQQAPRNTVPASGQCNPGCFFL